MLSQLQQLDYKNEQIELLLRKIYKWSEFGQNKPIEQDKQEPINTKKAITISLIMVSLYIIGRLITN